MWTGAEQSAGGTGTAEGSEVIHGAVYLLARPGCRPAGPLLHHHHHAGGLRATLFNCYRTLPHPMTCYIIIMQARHCLLPYPVSHDMLHHHHAGKTLFVTLPCVPWHATSSSCRQDTVCYLTLCPMTCYIIIIMQARHCLLPYPVSHDMLHHHHAGKTLFVTLPCVPWHATSSSCRQDTVCYLTLCPMTCYIIIIQVIVTLPCIL